MAVLFINSEEFKPETYKSIEISYRDDNDHKKTKVFNSGDFVKDFFNAHKFWVQEIESKGSSKVLCYSSSVDHFIMDGAPFDSTYLMFDKDDKPYLSYDYDSEGIELFVPRSKKWTWEELKKYVDLNE